MLRRGCYRHSRGYGHQVSPQVILILCLAPCYGFLAWAGFMGMKADQMYFHESWGKLSSAQRHRLVGVVVAFFALLAAVVVVALVVFGNLIVGLVAAAILVLLLRFLGLARSRRSES
jgi:uncharacterized BrkB/YihY/UPF0761 family membrane protein